MDEKSKTFLEVQIKYIYYSLSPAQCVVSFIFIQRNECHVVPEE